METIFRFRPFFLLVLLLIGGCSSLLPEGWEKVDTATLHRRYLPPGSPGRTAMPEREKENGPAEDPGYAARVSGMLFVDFSSAGR